MDHLRSDRILDPTIARQGLISSDLALPAGALGTDQPKSGYIRPIITGEEFTGNRMSEGEIIERLSRLSAYDCLQILGRLSCMVHGASHGSRERQRLIMRR